MYVALSRATSLDTLEVRNFDPATVKAHPHVLRWMGSEVDPLALAKEELQRSLAKEAYRQRLDKPEEEDDIEYAIEVDSDSD